MHSIHVMAWGKQEEGINASVLGTHIHHEIPLWTVLSDFLGVDSRTDCRRCLSMDRSDAKSEINTFLWMVLLHYQSGTCLVDPTCLCCRHDRQNEMCLKLNRKYIENLSMEFDNYSVSEIKVYICYR